MDCSIFQLIALVLWILNFKVAKKCVISVLDSTFIFGWSHCYSRAQQWGSYSESKMCIISHNVMDVQDRFTRSHKSACYQPVFYGRHVKWPPPRRFSFCLCVFSLGWLVCQLCCTKTTEWIPSKLAWRMGRGPESQNRPCFIFGADLDKGTASGCTLKGVFLFVLSDGIIYGPWLKMIRLI